MTPEEVIKRTILRGVVGSTAHGIAIAGTDDRDEMGICIEPPERVIGLRPFEQYVYRSAEEREPAKNGISPRSMPGDLDLTIYSLRKWCSLAGNGNPSIITLLYLPENLLVHCDDIGRDLRSKADMLISKEAGKRFLGYLRSQRARLTGEKGQKDVKRQDLIDKYGYDTKYAGHMLRLGWQGIELMQTGKLELPLHPAIVRELLAVRTGAYAPLEVVLSIADSIQRNLEDAIETSKLPDKADWDKINDWLTTTYLTYWEAAGW